MIAPYLLRSHFAPHSSPSISCRAQDDKWPRGRFVPRQRRLRGKNRRKYATIISFSDAGCDVVRRMAAEPLLGAWSDHGGMQEVTSRSRYQASNGQQVDSTSSYPLA